MLRKLPWAAAITGVTFAAWSLLRSQDPRPRGGLDLTDPEHTALLTAAIEAVIRAQRDQEPTDDGRRQHRMRAALTASLRPVKPPGNDTFRCEDRAAFAAVPVDVGAFHVRRDV